MDNVSIPASDLRTHMALEALKRNMPQVPLEALEAFVKQYETITN